MLISSRFNECLSGCTSSDIEWTMEVGNDKRRIEHLPIRRARRRSRPHSAPPSLDKAADCAGRTAASGEQKEQAVQREEASKKLRYQRAAFKCKQFNKCKSLVSFLVAQQPQNRRKDIERRIV
eukprot:6192868-Pleurochrysis_carterae.AAC.3